MSARSLSEVLAGAKAGNRAALVGYLPAGFPTVDGGVRAAVAMVEGGCDVIEIGLPHSDPVLDGPVIQTADQVIDDLCGRLAPLHETSDLTAHEAAVLVVALTGRLAQ